MLDIRAIKLEDIDQVYHHAYQIAMRSGTLSVDFILSKEKLINGLFGLEKDWHRLVVTENEIIIGSCLYCFANTNRPFNHTSAIFLDLLFVDSVHRFKGIGKLLIQEIEKIALKENITRIEFWCMKDNIEATKFYQIIGAKKLDSVDVYNLPIKNSDV